MSDSKKRRGKPSKIDQLPDDLRDRLHELLRGGMSQQAILDQINKLCAEAGSDTISRSGLSRYATRMEQIGSRIRESREIAEVWVAKLGTAPTSDIGKLLQEIVRTLAFDMMMTASESGQPMEPKALNQMALAMTRIEQAAMASHKRETEIRKAFAAEIADAAEQALANQGMTANTIATIKKEILGIA